MSILPDELWTRIMELGTSSSQLSYRDLCSISISCRRLRRLSDDPILWDFCDQIPPKIHPFQIELDQSWFERVKALRQLEWRRKVLAAENRVMLCRLNLKQLEGLIIKESERLQAALTELNNLERVRRASVALNVWQPEVVRGRQKQMVEQCTVPIESRLHSLNMEIKVCRQQIEIHKKSYNHQKQQLEEGSEELKSMKYNPLYCYQSTETVNNVTRNQKKLKKSMEEKKLKKSRQYWQANCRKLKSASRYRSV
ncbi:F-box protein SKIP24 isoform X3 [Asparagus officinalis]|uniref:F-box protein SKIP24 isoform X3 n=1 Tax=Asparagus officinalis TaxID=4686 RepID=UPI00098E1929|nr:F-box protein SKIP24 isoform X3 [Asparagus officinalis]